MKSLTGNSPSARGWALLLILFLGAGLFVAACGEEETPAPTTPPPAPPPTPTPPPPEPEPEAPAVPTGLHVDARTANSITWHWTAVEGAVGYVVQASMDETWEATDTVTFNGAPFTTETEYTHSGLEPETTVYVRVASAAGTVAAPVVSAFSTHVTGMTMAATPVGPPVPANLRVTGQSANSITWEWDAVEGATGYQSQFSGTSTFPTGFHRQGVLDEHQAHGFEPRRRSGRLPPGAGIHRDAGRAGLRDVDRGSDGHHRRAAPGGSALRAWRLPKHGTRRRFNLLGMGCRG